MDIFECGNKNKHKDESNLPLSTKTAYSAATLSPPQSSLFVKRLDMHMNNNKLERGNDNLPLTTVT
jgi:hypothetical protein